MQVIWLNHHPTFYQMLTIQRLKNTCYERISFRNILNYFCRCSIKLNGTTPISNLFALCLYTILQQLTCICNIFPSQFSSNKQQNLTTIILTLDLQSDRRSKICTCIAQSIHQCCESDIACIHTWSHQV